MAKLGEICTVVSGSTPKTSIANYWDGTVKWITPAELNENTFYIMDSARHITEEGRIKTGLSYMPAGTVILSSRAPIGKTAITGCEMCCNQGFKNLICSDAVHNEYLYFFLKSKTEYLNSLGRGATFKEISKAIVENIEVPLPDITKQKEISRHLKKLEQLISLRKQQLVKLDELVKARFVEMFGNAKLNPYGFPCNNFSEYIDFLTSGSRGWSQYFTDNGEYFITIKNVKNCRITLQDVQYVTPPDNSEAKRTKVQENDLLISITADLGRTGVVTKEIAEYGAYINQHLTCIRLNLEKVNPLYVAYYMESDAGKEQFASKNQSAVKAGLNFNAINSLKLIVPPLSLQNDFAAFVERVDQHKQTVQQSLDKLELMKKALMQEYFG